VQVAPDGKLWVTLCLGNKIGVFDPKNETWQLIDQKDGIYPHTNPLRSEGPRWYTLAVSNHVSMIDPKTGEQRTIRLPARTWGQALAVRVGAVFGRLRQLDPATRNRQSRHDAAVPYGIDIAPDGGVLFSQLNARRIGRIDPDTGRYELYDTPFPGPRRLRFDSQGICGFRASALGWSHASIRRRRNSKPGHLPTNPPGTETPYALNVDRKTDTVWICGTNSDT